MCRQRQCLRLADDKSLAGVHAARDKHEQAEQGVLGLDGRPDSDALKIADADKSGMAAEVAVAGFSE